MPGQSRELASLGNAGKGGDLRRRQWPRAAHIDVEPACGGGYLDVERLARRLQNLRNVPGGFERAGQARGKHRAAVDGHDVMRAQAGETDLKNIAGTALGAAPAPGVKHRAAPPLAMGIDQFIDVAANPGLDERSDHQIALPGAIPIPRPVLDRTPAAHAEMPADGGNALRTCRIDAEQMAPVWMAGNRLHLNGFARQRIGDIDRTGRRLGQPLAAMRQARDGQALSHGAPR
jgi:hypothetical protein